MSEQLVAALAEVRAALERHAQPDAGRRASASPMGVAPQGSASASPVEGTPPETSSASPVEGTPRGSASASPVEVTPPESASASPTVVAPPGSASASPTVIAARESASASPTVVAPPGSASASPTVVTPQGSASASPMGVTPQGSASASPVEGTPQASASASPLEVTAREGASASPLEVTADGPAAASPLERLCQSFGLSRFERQVVLLCAGMELDATFACLCAAAQGDQTRPYPTFGLALAALDDPHWSALVPTAPLRHWRLIDSGIADAEKLLTTSPLRIDERVLHYLAGVNYLDQRLAACAEPVRAPVALAPSQAVLANRLAHALSADAGTRSAIHLLGTDAATRREIAAAGCAAVGLRLMAVAAEFVPSNTSELELFLRLWEREAVLTNSGLLVEGEVTSGVAWLLERFGGPVLVSSDERIAPPRRQTLTLEVRRPTVDEQRDLWQSALAGAPGDAATYVELLVGRFDLSATTIRAIAQQALAADADTDADSFGERLAEATRAQARVRLDDLAQRIEPAATWDDLVLPTPTRDLLCQIGTQVAHRATIYNRWGFAAQGNRGLGISALFVGPSGTGKTMAAEVLATSLGVDLYRVDLASVVSKYIGETEKNLRRVFDAAENGGVLLFFDEADALFGKRGEVKDSHDRYANIEVNYLLQRMESYRGLAVLATNMKGALDPAFLRRIRFVVHFPFPDATQRADIWRRIFPSATPTADLGIGALARLNVAGGNIRTIALNAAFLAAADGQAVNMRHLQQAAMTEYAKLELPLSSSELGQWQ